MADRRELIERVAESRANRRAMLDRFGFIPESVLRLKRGPLSRSMWNYLGEKVGGSIAGASSKERVEGRATEAGRVDAEQRRSMGMLGGYVAETTDRTSVSVMAAELVEFFANYYCDPTAGAVYLDPFVGQGVQAQVAAHLGMIYRGQDVCHEYVEWINRMLPKVDGADDVHVVEGDSRSCDWIADGVGDFCFTSPPYWDIEFYGPEAGQLGTGKTYDEFMTGMAEVWRAWRPKFADGAYVVVNVNDIRRDGAMIPYHADTIAMMLDEGFTMHDTWIVDGMIAGLSKAFAVSHNRRRVVPKVHEYALVFRT